MTRGRLYFIALVLPDPVAQAVRAFQQTIADRFGSRATLRSPPHITLVPPFHMHEETQDMACDALTLRAALSVPFWVTLTGFGAFGNRVIYVHVIPSGQLSGLAVSLTTTLLNCGIVLRDTRRPFHPHVTIGYKDLQPCAFDAAWKYFEGVTIDRSFEAGDSVLLMHGDRRWEEERRFFFGRK